MACQSKCMTASKWMSTLQSWARICLISIKLFAYAKIRNLEENLVGCVPLVVNEKGLAMASSSLSGKSIAG